MRDFLIGALGFAYGALLAVVGALTLAGAGHGLLFLPPSLVASPFVFGPPAYFIAPFLWAALAVMASSAVDGHRRWARILLFLHYAGLLIALAAARVVAPEDMAFVERHGSDVLTAAVPLAAVYLAGQCLLWWILQVRPYSIILNAAAHNEPAADERRQVS